MHRHKQHSAMAASRRQQTAARAKRNQHSAASANRKQQSATGASGDRHSAANIGCKQQGAASASRKQHRAIIADSANPILEYHTQLRSGAAIAGQLVHMAYELLADGLRKGDFFYDAKKANKAIVFIEATCRHSEGRSDHLRLQLWQKAIVAAIFGVVDGCGLRVWREVFVVVGRKNGKSLFASALIAVMAFLDGEYGANIYCLAPKLEQAAKVFDAFHQMVQAEPMFAKRAQKRRSDIYIAESNTVIKPLAFNAKKSDGLNPHFVVNDEVHAWAGDRGLKQYEVMKSAQGARSAPLMLTISTSGYENGGIYDALMKRAHDVLGRISQERRLLPIVYTIDDVEKWDDMNEIAKANPNIDVSVPQQYFADELTIARGDLSKRREFLMKYCNIKQAVSSAAYDNRLFEDCVVDVSIEDFANCYAVGGIDLSQTTDLTAACVVIEREGVLHTFCKFFMPHARLEAAIIEDNVPYDIYAKQGHLVLSGGNHVNYKDVYNWFAHLHRECKIYPLQIGYDKWSAAYLVQDLQAYGFHTDDVRQGYNLTQVLRDFDGIIRDGKFLIAGNQLLVAHFLNVAFKHDLENRTFKPVKTERNKRIDGFIAVACAMTMRHKYYAELGSMLANIGK